MACESIKETDAGDDAARATELAARAAWGRELRSRVSRAAAALGGAHRTIGLAHGLYASQGDYVGSALRDIDEAIAELQTVRDALAGDAVVSAGADESTGR